MVDSRRVTSAFGITRPEGSLTVPAILPPTLAQTKAEDNNATAHKLLAMLTASELTFIDILFPDLSAACAYWIVIGTFTLVWSCDDPLPAVAVTKTV